MGLLTKSLTPQSSYAARKSGLWEDLMDELAGCFFPGAVDDFEVRCRERGLEIPGAYEDHLAEAIEARREELRSEDIGTIVRDRFDF